MLQQLPGSKVSYFYHGAPLFIEWYLKIPVMHKIRPIPKSFRFVKFRIGIEVEVILLIALQLDYTVIQTK